MALTKEHLYAVITGTQEGLIKEWRKILGNSVKQIDCRGSQHWCLRFGMSGEDRVNTCSIAVSFYTKLNDESNCNIRQLLTAAGQQKIFTDILLGTCVDNKASRYVSALVSGKSVVLQKFF